MNRTALHRKALNMLVLATVFWGLSFPLMKTVGLVQQRILPGSSSWFGTALTNGLRFGLASVVMGLFCYKTMHQITRREISLGAGLGFFGGIGLIFQMDGLNYTSASTSAFLTQAYCIVLPVVVALRDRKWPSLKLMASCALVVSGIGVLTGFDLRTFQLGRGEWETLIGSAIFTAQILWLDLPRFKGANVRHFTLVMFLVILAVSLATTALTAENSQQIVVLAGSAGILKLTALLVVFCTLIAYTMMNRWQPHVPASEAGLVYCAEPVFTSLFALVLPNILAGWVGVEYANETLTKNLLVGGGLIVGANILLQMGATEPSSD